jgi:hypothetical protein
MIYKHELVKCTCSDDQLHYVGCDCRSSYQVGYTIVVNPRGYFAEDTTRVAILAPEETPAYEFEAWARAKYGVAVRVPTVIRNVEYVGVTEGGDRFAGDNS